MFNKIAKINKVRTKRFSLFPLRLFFCIFAVPKQTAMAYKISEDEHKSCLECGGSLYGRPDKKFCSDSCKNRFHNRRHNEEKKIIERTLNALNRNHEYLDCLLKAGIQSIDIDIAKMSGFRPEVITGYRKTRSRHSECSCFDIKYCLTEQKIFRIRKMEIGSYSETDSGSGSAR